MLPTPLPIPFYPPTTVLKPQESQHISLMYDDQYSQWMQTIHFFLTRSGLYSLDLRFSDPDILHTPSLTAYIARCSSSLSSLRLELQSKEFFFMKNVDFKNVNFHFLQSITPQLHEFTLHEEKELSLGPRLASRTLAFSFPNARLLRFRFPCKELKLTLTVSPTLKTLSVMAKWLVLSCKSTAPLALHHLSLAGEWYEQARARYRVHLESMHRLQLNQNMFAKPPSIGAPNLQFLSFPSSKACDTPALAALQQDYPALALYCVVDRSFYWHRKGEHVSNGPLEIVRREKSGVLWDDDVGKKRAKNVREKMHSVNKKLVEGYTIDEDELYVLRHKERF
ncbi:unnamed protein product [Closterium sp. NIES-65]|nr:unnamed protein product [Closterium sp. NIES-65]